MGKVLVFQTSRLPDFLFCSKPGSWFLICSILFPNLKQPGWKCSAPPPIDVEMLQGLHLEHRQRIQVEFHWMIWMWQWRQCPCLHIFHTLTQRQDSVSLCYPLVRIDKDYVTKHHWQLTYWMSCWIWLCQGWSKGWVPKIPIFSTHILNLFN